MSRQVELRAGVYVDSVTLMQVSRRVADLPGVTRALVGMATELNLELIVGMGFEAPAEATPNQMLIAVEAEDREALDAGVAEVEVAIRASTETTSTSFGAAAAPLTIRAAARDTGATVALISTPGRYAFAEAIDAIDAGLHTMIFSDNVSLEQEVALKRYAEDTEVLVMGPDCGTAVIGGVGLGFANVVRPGPVGIVAASGTGAQQLMTLLGHSSVGVSHCLGVGGRDLSAAVGGRSTVRALDLLAADEDTEIVVLVSKPADEAVTAMVREHAGSLTKPVVFGLLGVGGANLTQVAERVVTACGHEWQPPEEYAGVVTHGRPGGFLRGLYAGGTLRDEAMLIASAELGPIGDDLRSDGHAMVDFGDDRFTEGRPHPMIDGSIRAERLRTEVADADTGVILLDVVLGYAASSDPAGELVDPVAAATAAGIPVVVAIIGGPDDPQGFAEQVRALHEAGAWVCVSNAVAAARAVRLLGHWAGGRR